MKQPYSFSYGLTLLGLAHLAPAQILNSPGVKLMPAALTVTDGFGAGVDLDGDIAVIGASGDDDNGAQAGAAYVFSLVAGAWEEQVKLLASDGQAGDRFGAPVALCDDTAFVGALGADSYSGVVYVFVRRDGGWTQQAKLTPEAPVPNMQFGISIGASGETVAIGAQGMNGAAGAVYVFVRADSTWTKQALLSASDADPGDNFGRAVTLSADTLIAGATSDDDAGLDAGAAYAFTRAGTVWTQETKIVPADAAPQDGFGNSLSLDDDTVLIGSVLDDGPGGLDCGTVYVYVRIGAQWILQQHLSAPDAATADLFGSSVRLRSNTAIIAAINDDDGSEVDTGSVHVFHRTGTSWAQTAQTTPDDISAFDAFGDALAFDESSMLVGTPHHLGIGATYAFDLISVGTWSSLGNATLGSAGFPSLSGTGHLLAGSVTTVSLSNARPFAPAPLIVGITALSAPFKGGLMVPAPHFIFSLLTDFLGTASFGGPWPPDVPSGFTTYFQWWIQDPAGPKGFAASNALAGTTP